MANPKSREDFIKKTYAISSSSAKAVLSEFIVQFSDPAFASLPKREIEILVFQMMQKLEIFDDTPELYDLVSSLHVTRSKARNLIYESNLRSQSREKLDSELLEIILKPIIMLNKKDCTIMLEVANPLLIDHLKSKMKELGKATDGSFSPDIVTMPDSSFAALIESFIPADKKDEIVKKLVKMKILKDKSIKGLVVQIVKSAGKKVIGEVADNLVEQAEDYLEPLLKGTVDSFVDKVKSLI